MSEAAELDLFAKVQFDPERYSRDLALPAAKKSYVIYFTPRSGSSWLSSVVYSVKALGNPDEWFNPQFIPNNSQAFNANDIEKYVEMLRRKRSYGGVFGVEITYHQLLKVFHEEERFIDLIKPVQSFYLTREDIVQQAVSLAKAAQTGVYHAISSSHDDVTKADGMFNYDANLIKRWVDHVLDHETRFETMFSRLSIRPIRLSYEKMFSTPPELVVRDMGQKLGISGFNINIESGHKKIGTTKNQEFSERFRKENTEYVDRISARRASD